LLEEHFTDRDNINIEIKRVPRQVSMLPGEYQLQFARRDPYHRLHGSDWYEVEVLQKGKSTASFRVRADVTQFVKVPTARNMIMNGDVIRAEDIVWEERESSSIYGGVITDTKSILGFETKRSFRAGQVIQKRSLERPLAVKRNKPVTIKYSFNGINVNAHGIAQGSGAIGEKIVVENSSSDERVYAEIIDKRTVQVINENN
jgi:flagella basal body P-ring formation protein FlgA